MGHSVTLDHFTEPLFETAALLTIDMQRDLLDGEPFCIPGTSAVLPQVRHLADAWRSAGRPLIHVVRLYEQSSLDVDRCRRVSVASGDGMVRPGTEGCQLAPGIAPDRTELDSEFLLTGGIQEVSPNEWILFKPRWGAFYRTALSELLVAKGITTVVVSGCNFPNCPRTTLYEASERDFRVVLVTDAVSGLYAQGERELEGIGAALMTTEEVVKSLRHALAV
jgi:nicotinamidase-related amidase